MTFCRPVLAALLLVVSAAAARAETIVVCTAVADADTGAMLVEEGECDTRATPASTFKIPIALMAFDAGVMHDTRSPAMPFREGYADWVPAWRQTTDPSRWMSESVVWYSQEATKAIGMDRFADYVASFDYGNEDVSGSAGKDDGLTNAWLSSSLAISPREQLAFLRRIVHRDLQVGDHAYEMTAALVDHGLQPGGWHVYGKTGAAPSRDSAGNLLWGQPWGWFVGWATRDNRRVVFARLTRDTTRPEASPGRAARAALLEEFFSRPDGIPD